jgi:hypothetical protein
MPPAPQLEAVVEDEEAIRVFHWRVHRFKDLGFTLWQARRLAQVHADWHGAELLLADGCPTVLAFDLLS